MMAGDRDVKALTNSTIPSKRTIFLSATTYIANGFPRPKLSIQCVRRGPFNLNSDPAFEDAYIIVGNGRVDELIVLGHKTFSEVSLFHGGPCRCSCRGSRQALHHWALPQALWRVLAAGTHGYTFPFTLI